MVWNSSKNKKYDCPRRMYFYITVVTSVQNRELNLFRVIYGLGPSEFIDLACSQNFSKNISYRLVRRQTYAYHGVRNVSFRKILRTYCMDDSCR